MRELPETLAQELEELPQHWGLQRRAVMDQAVLTALVRGVPVVMYVDLDAYPFTPPRLELSPGWGWKRRGFGRGRKIRGLDCLERWNRTLGIVAILRELEMRFRAEPPARRKSLLGAGREGRPPVLRALVAWLRGLVRRLFQPISGRAAKQVTRRSATAPEAIRSKYDQVIQEKTARVRRYKEAVTALTSQWQEKAARLDALRAEIRGLEESERQALDESRREVERLQGEGRTMAEIKADAEYRRRLKAFEQRSAALEERRERAGQLAAEAEAHREKLRTHEARLEELNGEVEDLRTEAEEMIADMTLVELEREIVDVRAGISRAGGAQELEDLRRQLRRARATVRVTREASDPEEAAGEADEYLEAARRVDAARRFEDLVGPEEAPEAVRRDRRMPE